LASWFGLALIISHKNTKKILRRIGMIYKQKIGAIAMALLLVIASMAMIGAPTASATPPPGTGSLTTSIFQTIAGVGTFAGTLNLTNFAVVNGVINAVGTISGTLTALDGTVSTLANSPISIPLASFTGTCTILTLHTGAIALNLLGLNVSLAPIDLVITATAAPGNLLGNLLCAVAHLLDSNASLGAITNLLNQILGAIRL
jgi:hypothetical protein